MPLRVNAVLARMLLYGPGMKTTPLRSVSRKATRSVKACSAPNVVPACDREIPAPPASVRRVRAPRKATPPVVAPPVVSVHHLVYGRRYVSFSGVEGAPTCRVTYSHNGYVRAVPAPEARRIYADLRSRGYVAPSALYSAAS